MVGSVPHVNRDGRLSEAVVERAGATLVGALAVLAVAGSLAWADGGDDTARTVAALTGWGAPAFALLAGYRWTAGLPLRQAMGELWRALLRPYVGWLAMLGLPVLAWESASAGTVARERARSLAWGGLALTPPLWGLWLVGGLIVALALARCAVAWLDVDLGWLLPTALALTYGGPLLVGLPAAMGLGGTLLSWVALGRLLRLLRPRLASPARGTLIGAVLALGGGVATLSFAGPVDVRSGSGGPAVLGPLASGAMVAGLVVLAEHLAGSRRVARAAVGRLAAADRLLLVALIALGIGPAIAAALGHGGTPGLAMAAALGGAVATAALVALLPRSSWLTGIAPDPRGGGRHVRRRTGVRVPASGTGDAAVPRF
jgi:hypothetical protein